MRNQGGLAGADLVEEVREAISKAASMGWSEQRPWLEEFVPINSLNKAFDVKRLMETSNDKKGREGITINFKRLDSRLSTNLVYFRTNYLIATLFFSVYTIVNNPWIILVAMAVGLGWIYVLSVHKGPPKIEKQHKYAILSIATFVVMWSTGIFLLLLYVLLFSTLFAVIHAVTRKRTLRSKFSKKMNDARFTVGSYFGLVKKGGLRESHVSDDEDDGDRIEEEGLEGAFVGGTPSRGGSGGRYNAGGGMGLGGSKQQHQQQHQIRNRREHMRQKYSGSNAATGGGGGSGSGLV